MVKKNGIVGALVIFAVIILQTTVLSNIAFKTVKPDLALIMVILLSNHFGSIKGQLLGFSSGLVQDFLSLSPFGFNALVKSVIGYISGSSEGKIFLDPIVVPIIVVIIGTTIKAVLSFLLILVFSPEKADVVFSIVFPIELGLNVVLSPVLYFILKLIRILPSSNRSRIS